MGEHPHHERSSKKSKKKSKILRMFSAFPKLVDRFFIWYGAFIADHSIWFVVIPLLATFVLAPGLMQIQRLTDDMKIWPMTGTAFTVNDINAKTTFNSYPSICSCVRCDDYGENCNRTIDCGSEIPKACQGAADGVDFTCPHIQLMFVSRNLSMTDPVMTQELMEVDMMLTFAKYSIQKFKPAFFLSNVSDWQICQRRPDGSCIQFSVLTGVRQQLSKVIPSLATYDAQTKFLMDLQADKEQQDSFKELMQSQSSKPTYYPFDQPNQPNAMFSGPIYGAVTMEKPQETWATGVKSGKVKHIGAMQFLYCLNDSDSMQDANMNWTRTMTKWLEERYTNNKTFKMFDLMVASSWSRLDRNGDEIVRMIPYLVVCIGCLMIFCGIATLKGFPAHRTMPWIGVIGVGTSVLGIGSSFGLVGWMQMQIVDLCFAIPVLILAVGIDDIFVYTEAWRSTKSEWLVRKRVAVTMKTAASGIVVTSFMNSLAFIIDTQTPFNALRIFSNVAVVSATFDFVYQMTLFPACLAIMNASEKKNRHACCCCCPIKARTNANYRNTNFWYLICCTAPKSTILKQEGETSQLAIKKAIESKDKELEKKKASEMPPNMEGNFAPKEKPGEVKVDITKKPSAGTAVDTASITSKSKESQREQHFFRDVYTKFLLKKKVSVAVLIIYVFYAAMCGYCLSQKLHVGLRFENMAPDRQNGELNEVQVWLKYFRNFSFPIDVIFNDRLDYWNNATQLQIASLYDDLLHVPNIGPDIISRNWLRDFVNYAAERKIDISTEESFLFYLRERFFKESKVRQDLLFDVKFADRLMDDYEELDFYGWKLPPIVSSRIFLYAVNIEDLTLSAQLSTKLQVVRRKHENSKLNESFYSREFVDTEPMLATAWVVVYNTLVQMASILLITALMMPHPVALFWITIMLSSITVGVIAFTCAWDIDFDQIAMVNIMLTMGYCVDFTAHMTRTYVSSGGKSRFEKTQEALGEFGAAVVQSSIAAILAVLCLGGSYAYILRSGFKFFFVGVLLSDFHTLIIFPVLLLHLGPPPRKQKRKHHSEKKKDDDNIDLEDIDARKIAKQVEKSLKREQRKREEKEIASIYGKSKSGYPWSLRGGSNASIASGPIKRAYIPDVIEIPPLTEFVEAEIVYSHPTSTSPSLSTEKAVKAVNMFNSSSKTFVLGETQELGMTNSTDGETSAMKSTPTVSSSKHPKSIYEKPPAF